MLMGFLLIEPTINVRGDVVMQCMIGWHVGGVGYYYLVAMSRLAISMCGSKMFSCCQGNSLILF